VLDIIYDTSINRKSALAARGIIVRLRALAWPRALEAETKLVL